MQRELETRYPTSGFRVAMAFRGSTVRLVVSGNKGQTFGVNYFLHGFCLVAQMSMRTRTTFPLTQ